MEDIKKTVHWLGHASFRLDLPSGAAVYLDPYLLKPAAKKADVIPEMEGLKADVALLPVGGTYTMDPVEACRAALAIKPRAAVPMHYGSVVGSREDAIRFKNLCSACEVLILPQEE